MENFGKSRVLLQFNRTVATLLAAQEDAASACLDVVTPVLYSVIDLLLRKFANNRFVSAAHECLNAFVKVSCQNRTHE